MDTQIMEIDERYISPLVPVKEAMATYEAMREFIKDAMVANRDYGVIPGTKKPTLLQPGAEKLMRFFSLDFVLLPGQHITDWNGQDHGGEPFFYYEFTGRAMRGSRIIAECVGSCNSWEKKYRYRQGNRVCPDCGQPTIFKSKNDPGFYCWGKKGGCGAKFPDNDERITKQEMGMVKNPDIFDAVNTIQKMAIKRSLVGVALIACNAHEYFTQDVEDYTEGEFEEVHETQTNKLKPREEQNIETEPEKGKKSDRGDVQHYWNAIKKYGIDHDTGVKISQECGLDFGLAIEKLHKMYKKEGDEAEGQQEMDLKGDGK